MSALRLMSHLIAVSLLLLSANSALAEFQQGQKDTLLIAEVQTVPSVLENAKNHGTSSALLRFKDAFQQELSTAVSNTRVFELVERTRIKEVMTEQEFNQSGLVDPAKAVEMFKLSGARYTLMPTISSFEDRVGVVRHEEIGRQSSSRTAYVSASVKIVDNSTGTVLPDVPSTQRSRSENQQLAMQGAVVGSQQLLVNLAAEVARELSQRVIGLVRPPKVLNVDGKRVLINRGEPLGFAPGTKIQIYATKDITDPDTGEIFKDEVLVGKGKITQSDPQKSFAELEGEDLGVAPGCLVKRQGEHRPSVAHEAEIKSKKTAVVSESPGSAERPW